MSSSLAILRYYSSRRSEEECLLEFHLSAAGCVDEGEG